MLYGRYVKPQDHKEQSTVATEGITSETNKANEPKSDNNVNGSTTAPPAKENTSAISQKKNSVAQPPSQAPAPQVVCDYNCLNAKLWKAADPYLADKRHHCDQISINVGATSHTFTYDNSAWFINGVYSGSKSYDCSYIQGPDSHGISGSGGEAGRFNCNDNFCSDETITRIPGH